MENIIISGFADEIDPNLDKQIEVVKRLGISYIEMRGVNGKGLVEYSLDDVREIKKILDKMEFVFLQLVLLSEKLRLQMRLKNILNFLNTP